MAAKFLTDLCILLYLVIKPLFSAFIPKSLLYKELKNEVVLVTGGGNGIGRLLSIKLSALGCQVVVCDVREKDGQHTVKLIRENGDRGYFYPCDISKRKDVYATAKKIKDEVGLVSILINNAGVTASKSLLDCPDHLIENVFGVNTLAHFWTCKAFLPDMIINNCGHIVNVASLAGVAGVCGLSGYCSSKSAVIGFHESLYMELKKDECSGIKTTLVCTWLVNTNMFRGAGIRLLSPLEANDVAERIISAIRSNGEVVIIPWYFKLGIILKSMFPLSVVTKFLEMGGAFSALDNYIGNDI